MRLCPTAKKIIHTSITTIHDAASVIYAKLVREYPWFAISQASSVRRYQCTDNTVED